MSDSRSGVGAVDKHSRLEQELLEKNRELTQRLNVLLHNYKELQNQFETQRSTFHKGEQTQTLVKAVVRSDLPQILEASYHQLEQEIHHHAHQLEHLPQLITIHGEEIEIDPWHTEYHDAYGTPAGETQGRSEFSKGYANSAGWQYRKRSMK